MEKTKKDKFGLYPASKQKVLPQQEIIARHLYINALNELGAERVGKTSPHVVIYYEEEKVYEFDWEIILFVLPTGNLQQMIKPYLNLIKKRNIDNVKDAKKKTKEKKLDLILPQTKIIGDAKK